MTGQEDRMGTRGDRIIRGNRFDYNERMNQYNRYSNRRPTFKNIPSRINDRTDTKAWNILKNFLPTGGNVGRHVGNYLVDRFNLGYGGDNGSSGIVNSGRDNNIFQDYKNYIDTNFDFDFGNKEASWIPELWGGRARVGVGPNNLFLGWGKKF